MCDVTEPSTASGVPTGKGWVDDSRFGTLRGRGSLQCFALAVTSWPYSALCPLRRLPKWVYKTPCYQRPITPEAGQSPIWGSHGTVLLNSLAGVGSLLYPSSGVGCLCQAPLSTPLRPCPLVGVSPVWANRHRPCQTVHHISGHDITRHPLQRKQPVRIDARQQSRLSAGRPATSHLVSCCIGIRF